MDIKFTRIGSLATGTQTSGLRPSSTNTETKSSKVDQGALNGILSRKIEVRQPITSIEEARKITSELASELGDSFFTDKEKDSVIKASTGSLDPDRVQALLSEEH